MIKTIRIILLITTILLQSFSFGRTWTDRTGRQFEGDFQSVGVNDVTIRRISDGRVFTIDRSLLSDEDQQYLKNIENEKEVSEFIEKYPSTLNEAIKLSKRKNLPAIIFYRAGSSRADYILFTKKYLMEEQFLDLIKRRAILAFVAERDDRFHEMVNPEETVFAKEPWFYAYYHEQNTSGWNSSSQPPGVQQPILSKERFLENFESRLANAENMKR